MKKFYGFIILLFLSACASFYQPQETWVENAQNEKIYVKVFGLENKKYNKLAILQHGLASDMNHQAIRTAKQVFLDNKFVVITFDSRHSLGEGDNDVEKVSLQSFTEDLETMVNWAKTKSLYSENFALSGHSLGGASVIKFAAEYPDKVSVLIPIAPVVSGKLWEESCMKNMPDFCRQWKNNKTYTYTDEKNHKTAIIPYKVVESCAEYNAYDLAPQIAAKTLLITAEKDKVINPEDVKGLAKKIKNGTFEVIENSGHNFNKDQNLSDLYKTIDAFLK